VGSVGAAGDAATYDLRIASTEDVLPLEAFTSADALCSAPIGPTAGIVP
jgi:hypothetical protein